jgi:hypothetical protein
MNVLNFLGFPLVITMNPVDVVATRLYNQKVVDGKGVLYSGSHSVCLSYHPPFILMFINETILILLRFSVLYIFCQMPNQYEFFADLICITPN